MQKKYLKSFQSRCFKIAMTAAFQLCAEEMGKLLMMLLIFLLSESRVLASTSKGMMFTPSICNTELSSSSVYKATGNDALSCGPEDLQRKTSCCDELGSDSSARVGKGVFFWISVRLLHTKPFLQAELMCSPQAGCLAGVNAAFSPTSMEIQPFIPADNLS